jgi:hypothetical protein
MNIEKTSGGTLLRVLSPKILVSRLEIMSNKFLLGPDE